MLFAGSYEVRGMERHVVQLAHGLVARHLPVAAICDSREEIRPFREALTEAGAVVHTIPGRREGRLGSLRRFSALVQILRRYRGCLLHCHYSTYWGGDLLLVAAKLAGVGPIVRSDHNSPILPITGRDRLRARLRDSFYSRTIYVSVQNRQEHVRWLGRDERKAAVVLHGIDLARFSPSAAPDGVRRELGLDASSMLVGTVGSLSEERKGVSYFLEMAAALARDMSSLRFLVVGDGLLRERLEAQAEELDITDRVVFMGQRSDVPGLLAAMNVFVMPSLYEGGPLTVLEAMAVGRPIVSTPVGCVPEVLEDGISGLVVPAGDSAALARAVRELLLDRTRAWLMAERARRLALCRFSLDAMVDRVIRVYREAVQLGTDRHDA